MSSDKSPQYGMINGDFNWAQNVHEWQLEVYGIKTEIQRGITINFRLEGLAGVTVPHTDALVIQTTITNYVVAKVFVDTGSSVNIIFKDVFDQMQVNLTELHHSTTSLFGFTCH